MVGKIAEFNVNSDNWRLYVERLEQYFVVNDIAEDHQVPTLITVMGAECYELLVSLCTPHKPCTMTFAQLSNILGKHLQPKPSELAERFKFRQRKQGETESISEYVAILRKMSKTCNFGTWLTESLRDQLVCGIRNESIRQRLFAENELDFEKAFNLAISMETAEINAATVNGGSTSVSETSQLRVLATRRVYGAAATARPRRNQGNARSFQEGAISHERGAGSRRAAGNNCRVCGGAHEGATCKFASYVCRVCNKQGHLRRVCPLMVNQHRVNSLGNDDTDTLAVRLACGAPPLTNDYQDDSDEVIISHFNPLSIANCKPIMITLKVQDVELQMECDTGSAVSCISFDLYNRLFKGLKIKNCSLRLRYYTGELVTPVGVIQPLVKYKDQQKYLDLYVINNGKTILLGRQWLSELHIQIPICSYSEVNNVHSNEFDLTTFSSRYHEVFAEGLGRFTGGLVSIHLREDARPVFMRARPLAYALRAPVERALDQLVRDGVLTPVDRSDWATPIVPVVKKDGTIRICADYKITLNKVLEIDRYPLPRVEDLLTRLHGGERFTKIDLSQAYAQLELDDSRKYTVINTHKGLFMYNRLVYGLASAPGIFQRRLEQLFADLPHVGVFLDDIIITGKDTKSHMDNLCKVFQRLQANGLRVNKGKCVFFEKSVTYLGHVISKAGVHTCPDKIKAIMNTAAPKNVSELRAFIGMIMYYAKFVRNVSTMLTPLYNLLRSGVRFVWSEECQAAFECVKDALVSSEVLVHYSEALPLVLTVDASSVGVGAVISHHTPNGERPVAYASRTLTSAERAYAQIDREALAIIFGVRKFHQYLYGRKFTLRTDHKPLTYIFGNKVGIPVMAASRLQRWAVLLSGYNYNIEYVASGKNCADALSRLSQVTCKTSDRPADDVTYLNFVENFLPVTNKEVSEATAKDIILSRVFSYVQSGWPPSCSDKDMQPFYSRRHELYIDRGCVMWGYRIVIPHVLRSLILKQLHISHMGIVKTKSLARSYVWWPGIDTDVEAVCRQCSTCAAEAPAPARAPPQPWPYIVEPWSRLHIDFLGPLNGKTFLVIVDSSTKWLEIFEMSRTNASSVIRLLKATFARFGLPTEVVSDQGPPFSSAEFKSFLMQCGIRQSFSPVYHPASNGAAENAVKLCKRAIKKALRDRIDVDTALQTYLLAYRNSVHSTTGESPAVLLQRRQLRTRWDLLRGTRALTEHVDAAQRRQVEAATGASQVRELTPGHEVWARGYTQPDKWVEGRVIKAVGSRRYILDNGEGKQILRHVDQIRRRSRLSSVPNPSLDENGNTVDGDEHVDVSQPGTSTNVDSDKSLGEEVVSNGNNGQSSSRDNQPIPSLLPQKPPPRSPIKLRPLPCRIQRRLNLDDD